MVIVVNIPIVLDAGCQPSRLESVDVLLWKCQRAEVTFTLLAAVDDPLQRRLRA